MAPAMDRVLSTLARRSWIGLGLALGLVDLGCSQLPWRKPTEDPPMLGRITDTTDIYAMSRRPGTQGAVASPIPTETELQGMPPRQAQVDEVGMAMRPAGTPPDGAIATGAVALQAPTPLDARAITRSTTPSDGVPDASRVLATAGRRGASSPTPQLVVTEARTALDAMASYEVALHRQERVNGTLLPEEDVVLAIRREPRAVRLTWPSGPNEGREVLYRADEPGGPMHVKMANPALPRLTLPPESPMVMRNSRHPVTEAGLDSIIEGLENAVRAPASGIAYAGLETAEGLDQPHHCLTQISPTGDRWRIYLNPKTHLPSLVVATDADGQLLERYLFHNVRPDLPELAAKEAFDANARWGAPKGLFGRLARGDSAEPSTTPR